MGAVALLALAIVLLSIGHARALVVPAPIPPVVELDRPGAAHGSTGDLAGGVPPATAEHAGAHRSLPAPPARKPARLLRGKADAGEAEPEPVQPTWQGLGAAKLPGAPWQGVMALARLTFEPGAVLAVDDAAGAVLLAVEAGALEVILTEGNACLGRANGAEAGTLGGPLTPGAAIVIAAGEWLSIQPGTTLSARGTDDGRASALVATLVGLPPPLKR